MMREMPFSSTPLQSYDGTGRVPGALRRVDVVLFRAGTINYLMTWGCFTQNKSCFILQGKESTRLQGTIPKVQLFNLASLVPGAHRSQ